MHNKYKQQQQQLQREANYAPEVRHFMLLPLKLMNVWTAQYFKWWNVVKNHQVNEIKQMSDVLTNIQFELICTCNSMWWPKWTRIWCRRKENIRSIATKFQRIFNGFERGCMCIFFNHNILFFCEKNNITLY